MGVAQSTSDEQQAGLEAVANDDERPWTERLTAFFALTHAQLSTCARETAVLTDQLTDANDKHSRASRRQARARARVEYTRQQLSQVTDVSRCLQRRLAVLKTIEDAAPPADAAAADRCLAQLLETRDAEKSPPAIISKSPTPI